MFWFSQSVQWIGILLLALTLVLVWQSRLQRRFPLFTAYVTYMMLATLLRSIFLSTPDIYFFVYWYAEPGAFLLKLLAVHESFMHVFRTFYLMKWFRFLLPGTIVAALVSSVLRTYTHPAHGSPVAEAVIAAATTAQQLVLAIAVLFVVLVIFFRLPWRVHEYRIVLGFGVSSFAIFLEGALRSEFGTTFNIVTTLLAGVSYLLALVIWLTAVRHPLAAEPDFPEQGISPEALVREVRRQLEAVRALLHRG